jgi:chemotaxis protein MotA
MVVLIGLILGFVSMIGSFMLEGGHFMALMEPTAAMIVFGGTIATIVISFPVEDLKRLPKICKVLFSSKKSNTVTLISYFKDLSFKTRKNGLLSIESEITADANMDPFIKKGLQMVVDGVEGQAVRSILELQAEMTYDRHGEGYAMFEAAGGFAPTMGIIGTVMGLVHVLGNLDDPASLGPKIAVAFIATLYGVGSANLMYLPMGAKLKALNNQEMKERTLIVEAILFIQEGVNPNTIAEKLKSFLDPKELAKFDELNKKVE